MSLGAAKLLRDRAEELAPDEPVPSPCISVCTMNADTELCKRDECHPTAAGSGAPVDGGVVTVTGPPGAEALPAASRAITE